MDKKTDQELIEIYLKGTQREASFFMGGVNEGIVAVRAAVEAPLLAEIERLKSVWSATPIYETHKRIRKELEAERDALRAKLAEAEKEVQAADEALERANENRRELQREAGEIRQALQANNHAEIMQVLLSRTAPCRVTFDCTADQFNTHFASIDRGLFEPEVIPLILDYLSTRVRVVVPDEVPSSQEICTAIKFDGNLSHYHVNRILQYLAPFFARPVDVEPSPDTLATVLVNELMSSGITNVCFDAQPAKEKTALRCAAIAVWNHQRHARLVDPALCETRLRLSKPIANLIYTTPNGEYLYKLNSDTDPADAARASEWLASAAAKHGVAVNVPRMKDESTGVDKIWDAETRKFVDPIAPPETLEALADMARKEFGGVGLWKDLDSDGKQLWIDTVSAVLANAGAYVDVKPKDVSNIVDKAQFDCDAAGIDLLGSYAEFLDWLNSRIRFRVQPQPVGATLDVTKEKLAVVMHDAAPPMPPATYKEHWEGAAQAALDLIRSRMKPCAECEKNAVHLANYNSLCELIHPYLIKAKEDAAKAALEGDE